MMKERKKLKDILSRVGIEGVAGSEFILSDNLFSDGWGTNEDANAELHNLLTIQNLFDFPKPSKLISKLIMSIDDKDVTIIDFFSGSATAAHATIQLNAKDNGNRKFIMVQYPEECDENSETYKQDIKTYVKSAKNVFVELVKKSRKIIKTKKELRILILDLRYSKLEIQIFAGSARQ